MLADDVKEGTPVRVLWKTENSVHEYTTKVLVMQGDIVGLSAIYENGDIVLFEDGDITLNIGEKDVFPHVKVFLVDYKGMKIYLTYGRKEHQEKKYVRQFQRFPVNGTCYLNGYPAKLFDVSANGFGVICEENYREGVWTEMKVKSVKVFGKIRHKSEVGVGMYYYGCLVEEATPNFVKFVHDQEEALKANQMLNEEMQAEMEREAKERARIEEEKARQQEAARLAAQQAAQAFEAKVEAQRAAEEKEVLGG
ncbi:MAG: PilZ domain-containing protein [Lachnospiraceae bacterium]|nr:PilZ domain-containing protein [Lachnospiraceae bacterium]